MGRQGWGFGKNLKNANNAAASRHPQDPWTLGTCLAEGAGRGRAQARAQPQGPPEAPSSSLGSSTWGRLQEGTVMSPRVGVGWGAHTISLDYSLILIPRGRVIYPVLVITATPASGPGPSLLQSPLPLAEGLKCLGRTRTQVSPSHGPTLTPGACTASPCTNQHTGRVVAADTFTGGPAASGRARPVAPGS